MAPAFGYGHRKLCHLSISTVNNHFLSNVNLFKPVSTKYTLCLNESSNTNFISHLFWNFSAVHIEPYHRHLFYLHLTFTLTHISANHSLHLLQLNTVSINFSRLDVFSVEKLNYGPDLTIGDNLVIIKISSLTNTNQELKCIDRVVKGRPRVAELEPPLPDIVCEHNSLLISLSYPF